MSDFNAVEERLAALRGSNPREAAEFAYVLAMLHKRAGNDQEAARFGKETISLFDQCEMESMEQCAAINVVVEGIALPSLIHQQVVRNRLDPIEL